MMLRCWTIPDVLNDAPLPSRLDGGFSPFAPFASDNVDTSKVTRRTHTGVPSSMSRVLYILSDGGFALCAM